MNKDEALDQIRTHAAARWASLKARLDIDGDADVDADDIVAAVRKYEWLKIGLAVVVGFVVGAVVF